MAARHYQILDVGLRLDTGRDPVLEHFHQDYRRFEVPEAGPARLLDIRYGPPGPGGDAFLEVDGVRQDLAGHPRPDLHASRAIAQAVMDRVEAYTVLHAAVLGSPEGALALAGAPCAGKTTTALALLAAGWSYLSDDFCPLAKETGQVHPFPRSLWVRPALGEAATDPDRGKVLFPLEEKGFRIQEGALPLKWFICLGEGDAPQTQQFRVGLREGQEGPFLEALQRVEGLAVERPGGAASREWLVRYPRIAGRTEQVKEILERQRGAVWNVYTLQGPSPDFTRAPRLERLSSLEAAFFILRELKHTPGRGGVKPGALLAHLGSLLAGASCYRLSPGPMDSRMALIQDAVMGRPVS